MKRKIVIILGSKNDLKQCLKGLELLGQRAAERYSGVSVSVYVKSAHRHTTGLLWLLDAICQAESEADGVNVIITGAGWAAALPGLVDAYLRYHHKNKSIKVIGVAFSGKGLMGIIHTITAILSIKFVPKTQVLYAGWGRRGFLKAARLSSEGLLPEITLPDVPPVLDLTLTRAIELANNG